MTQDNDILKRKVETDSIKCSSCGSNMVFDPETQMLYCAHCGRKETFGQKAAKESDILRAFGEAADWKEESGLFRCENCGAEIVLDKSECAKTCPFCGTAHVVESADLPGIKPTAVVPFSISKESAAEKSKAWARKKWFAPRAFKKNLNVGNVRGVYIPCFTFDSNTFSKYVGRIGTTHERVVGSGKDKHVEEYTEWRNISGTFSYFFDDVTVSACQRTDRKTLAKLEPFDSNGGKLYESKYLLGFVAYHYDRDVADCWDEAKESMDKMLKKLILSQYAYDKLDYIKVDTEHSDVTYKYVLLPVYVGNFVYASKNFSFFVNGETGKVAGKAPISGWRIALVVLIAVAAVVGAVFLAGAL